jgi:tripartite-type tricarboxylate transporter receptor subunit TctC
MAGIFTMISDQGFKLWSLFDPKEDTMRIRFISTMLATAALLTSPTQANEAWPVREVRMVTPYAAGSGASDAIARLFAERLKDIWKQPVIMENIPGAAGSVGIGKFVRERPDGYTIATSGDAPIAVNISLYTSLTYHPLRDLAPIIQIGRAPNILVVNAERGPKTLAELVAEAKRRPGALTFNSAGVGTSQHIAIEQLKLLAGVDVVHVPGRGATAPDVMGGHIDASFINIAVALPHVRAGSLRALAQSGSRRAIGAPDIPTVAELGYPGFDAVPWFGLFAPAGTPDAIIRKINADATQVMADPAFRVRLVQMGIEVSEGSTPESFRAFIQSEIDRMAAFIKTSGMKAE